MHLCLIEADQCCLLALNVRAAFWKLEDQKHKSSVTPLNFWYTEKGGIRTNWRTRGLKTNKQKPLVLYERRLFLHLFSECSKHGLFELVWDSDLVPLAFNSQDNFITNFVSKVHCSLCGFATAGQSSFVLRTVPLLAYLNIPVNFCVQEEGFQPPSVLICWLSKDCGLKNEFV